MTREGNNAVVIVGGGLVGCSLALALAALGRDVMVVESSAGPEAAPPGFDERNLALARGSLLALQRLGVLPRLARPPAPIRQIHVSRVGDFGTVRLTAADHGVDAFGGVVMARDLGDALMTALAAQPRVRRLAPARLVDMRADGEGWALVLQTGAGELALGARLLVAADGAESGIRTRLGIAAARHDYRQHLLVCSLAAPAAMRDCAWERFSATGPLALLPRNDGRLGAVCGVSSDEVHAVQHLDEAAWLAYLQQRFGWRAGRFVAAGKRVAYPLQQVVAERLVGSRAVLVGNAAQALHPIGAQGFNLGLRDAVTLASLIDRADDPGADALLAEYAAQREEDRRATLAFSDGLARLTASEGPLPHLLRSLGLLALGRSAALQGPLVQGAMGLRGMPTAWLGEVA